MRLISRFNARRSLKLTHIAFPQNTLQRCLKGFKTISVLEILFVRLPTCGSLFDMLAASRSLESVRLSEIYWKDLGNIPAPRSFQYLHSLSVHCEEKSQILSWLSKGSLPAPSRLSIHARSGPQGEFLRKIGSSLQHLRVKMLVNRALDLHEQNES